MTPLPSLNGRAPCEVVMGIRPVFPSILMGEYVPSLGVNEYVDKLLKYQNDAWNDCKRVAEEHAEELQASESAGRARQMKPLNVGDFVLVCKPPLPSTQREGRTVLKGGLTRSFSGLLVAHATLSGLSMHPTES